MGNAPLQNPCFGLYFMKKRGVGGGILRAQKPIRINALLKKSIIYRFHKYGLILFKERPLRREGLAMKLNNYYLF